MQEQKSLNSQVVGVQICTIGFYLNSLKKNCKLKQILTRKIFYLFFFFTCKMVTLLQLNKSS